MSSIEGVEDPFGPETAGGTALLEREEAQLSEPGDHERFSHYVRKEKIMESALTGVDSWTRSPEIPSLPNLQRNLRGS